jgi:hypothetical protein
MAYDFGKPPLPNYMNTSREGLINSGFHSEICSWAGHQGEFSGHPLVRESVGDKLEKVDAFTRCSEVWRCGMEHLPRQQ